jgi:hypothetical protein
MFQSCNALLHMLLVCIRSYLKSVTRCKFLIFDTHCSDTLYLCAQGCEDLWLCFEAKRASWARNFWETLLSNIIQYAKPQPCVPPTFYNVFWWCSLFVVPVNAKLSIVAGLSKQSCGLGASAFSACNYHSSSSLLQVYVHRFWKHINQWVVWWDYFLQTYIVHCLDEKNKIFYPFSLHPPPPIVNMSNSFVYTGQPTHTFSCYVLYSTLPIIWVVDLYLLDQKQNLPLSQCVLGAELKISGV